MSKHSEATKISRKLAAKIALIQDPVERNHVARETCLQLIVRFPHLREHVFLRQCRVPDCEGGLGPKLRVKKTKCAIRVERDPNKPWGGVNHTRARIRIYKSNLGVESKDWADINDNDFIDGRYATPFKSMNGELQPVYVWQNRMW